MFIRKHQIADQDDLQLYVRGIVYAMARRGCDLEEILCEVDRCCESMPGRFTSYGMNPRGYADWSFDDFSDGLPFAFTAADSEDIEDYCPDVDGPCGRW